MSRRRLRLAVVRDMREERWPSMDLVADMLVACLERDHADLFASAEICPPMRSRLGRIGALPQRLAFNADRLVNRFWDYPRVLRGRVADFDLFHLCDHSYAQLVHKLPAERAGVFCHDLDAFRCLLDPASEPRPFWFRKMARRILTGMQSAAVVFHSTDSVREQIERHGLVDTARLVKAPYGVPPEFFERDGADDVPAIEAAFGDAPFLLHVGSCIPRKRVDVLLDVFAGVVARVPELRLVHLGGDFTSAHQAQIDRLGIRRAVHSLPSQSRQTLAAIYRKAALVLLPSEAEGFGLPVVEALASGAIVVASDIRVLREVGGDAAVYCPTADVAAWVDTVRQLLSGAIAPPEPDARMRQARLYSWEIHTRIIREAYERLA